MKVIQILPELQTGGVERGTLEVGKYLVEQGHESIVISNGGRLVEQLEAEGSRHITLPVHKKRLSSLTQIRVLRKLFSDERPDIIHVRSRMPAWLAWLAWRKMNIHSRPKFISTVHGFYSVNAYSRIMTRGKAVICVSNSVRDYVRKNYPDVPDEVLTVIHRGVDPMTAPYGYQPSETWRQQWESDFPQVKGKFVITLPGRITRWKGQLDFLQVIGQLKAAGLPVHGLIVGEAHPRKIEFFHELKTAIQSQKLENDVTLVGHRSDPLEIMAVSDIVVSCSTDPEAFGRVSLEALSIGKPVFGYHHGGVAEQLDKLYPRGAIELGKTDEMAQAILNWQKSPSYPEKKNPFTLENMCLKTTAVYQRALST